MASSDSTILISRSELELPPFNTIFHSSFFIPVLAYFAFFRLTSSFVKNILWQEYRGFKQYRLHNLSVCFLHSLISGVWSIGFLVTHQWEMFHNVIHWYEPWAAQLPMLSIAYFIHDAFDMLNHEWSRWTLELLFHHTATCIALISGLLPHKLLLADYWALLMEGNSIFLHIRTIMQISGISMEKPSVYKVIIYCNIISFILCRFVAQALFVRWVLGNVSLIHPFYTTIGLGGPVIFAVINGTLFFRLLIADGFLGEQWKKSAAINRDQSQVKLLNGNVVNYG